VAQSLYGASDGLGAWRRTMWHVHDGWNARSTFRMPLDF